MPDKAYNGLIKKKGDVDMNNTHYIIGLIIGLAVGLVLAAFAIRYCRGSWKYSRSKYDERQKIAMGKAYRDGFWTLLIAVVLVSFVTRIPEVAEYSETLFATACFIGIGVYIVGCIMRDAYMGINDNAKRWTVILVIIGVINLIGAVALIRAEGIFAGWLNLLCVALILLVLFTYGIRYKVKKKEIEDE